MWFFNFLPDLQSRYSERHAKDRYDPEPCHDLALMIPQLLIMMMQGAHEKNPSPLAVFFLRIPEIGYLYHYAQVFHQEYAAEDGDQPFLPHDDGQGGDDAPQGKAARVAHEYLCRVGIIPEEAHAGADEGAD